MFDGTCGHGVQLFRGERSPFVFFTMRRFERVAHTTRRALRRVHGGRRRLADTCRLDKFYQEDARGATLRLVWCTGLLPNDLVLSCLDVYR